MRDIQLEREKLKIGTTNSNELLASIRAHKDGEVISEMVDKVVAGIAAHHNAAERKRSAFFKITAGLDYEAVAVSGLSILLSKMASSASAQVTAIGTEIGNDLLIISGNVEDVYSDQDTVIKNKVFAGITLANIIFNALPKKFFHIALRRVSKLEQQWEVTVTESFTKLLDDHKDLFPRFSRKFEPMVCRPDQWTGTYGGGYLSKVAKQVVPLMKRNSHHESPSEVVLNGINHIQQTPYRVHTGIYGVCLRLKELRPAAMSKVFKEVLGDFQIPCPIDKVEDAYIWSKVEGKKLDKRTGKMKKAMVLEHTDDQSVEKRKAFFNWVAEKELHEKHELGRVGISAALDAAITLADDLISFENLYWPITNDSRSRMYPAAMAGINIHGSDFQKAIVEFSEGLPLDHDGDGEGGEYAIVKTLCNHWGKDSGNGVKTDKLTKEASQKWIQEASEWIVQCARDPFGENSQQWMTADKPLQFLAAAMEWADWLVYKETHNDYGFISRLCDPNDASCSGAQILSAMTRDEVGAMHTNLMNLEVQDLYMAVADKVTGNLLEIFDTDTLAQDWLGRSGFLSAISDIVAGKGHDILTEDTQDLIIDLANSGMDHDQIFLTIYKTVSDVERLRMSYIIRDLVKKPVMVKFYSGTRYGNIEHVAEFILKNKWSEHFRCDSSGKPAVFMGNLIYDSINQVVKGAGKVMEWFIHVADVFGSLNKSVRHLTPSGYPITLKKYKSKKLRVACHFQGKMCDFQTRGIDKKVDENGVVQPQIDTEKFKSSIAPDIVHSFDSSLLMLVADRCQKEGINNLWFIHDSLGTHCCYSTRFSRIIRECFVEMFSEDVLQNMYLNFCEQLGNDSFLLQSPEKFGIKYGTYDLNEIKSSEFAFK